MKKKQIKQLLKVAKQSIHQPEKVDTTTIKEWSSTYEAIIRSRDYKRSTVNNKIANLNHVRRIWGQHPVATLRPFEITQGLKEFTDKHSSTGVRVLSELKDFYSEAIANGLVDTNPATSAKHPKSKVKRKRITFENFLRMLEVSRQPNSQPWLECLLLLALVTGQRRADLAKMSFDDIVQNETGDWFLRIEQQKQAGKGYGARVEIPILLRLDTLNMSVKEVLKLCKKTNPYEPILLRKHNGQPLELSSLSTRFHECIVEALGEDAYEPRTWPSLHEVRSLSARLYYEQGVDVQTLLGHKHAEMTEIYKDDRGLSADQWKRVNLSTKPALLEIHNEATHKHGLRS